VARFPHHATLCIAAYGFLIAERGAIPLRTMFRLAALGICHSQRLPTQRRRRFDPNGTSPTRSPQCEDASSSLSPRPSRDDLAAIRRSAGQVEFPITDAVRLKYVPIRSVESDDCAFIPCLNRRPPYRQPPKSRTRAASTLVAIELLRKASRAPNTSCASGCRVSRNP